MARRRGQFIDAERAAYHEAGHAVAAYCLKVRFRYASLDPKDLGGEASGGVVRLPQSAVNSLRHVDLDLAPRSRAESFIRVLLAGMIGEGLLSGKYDRKGSEQDLHLAFKLAFHMSGSEDEQGAYVTWLWESTKNLLSHGWQKEAVRGLAKALLRDKKISYRKARTIIATAEMAYAPGPGR